jgi:hypothetical protein
MLERFRVTASMMIVTDLSMTITGMISLTMMVTQTMTTITARIVPAPLVLVGITRLALPAWRGM